MSHYNTIIRAADALQLEADKYKTALEKIGATCWTEEYHAIALEKIDALANEALKKKP